MPTSDSSTRLTSQPLLLPVAQVAALLGRSERSVWRDAELGKMPPPLKLGRSRLWRVKELRRWVRAGCPRWSTWEGRSRSGERT